VAEVPAAISSPTSDLGALFAEAPVPRSRRRSSLLPQAPGAASGVAKAVDASVVTSNEHLDADREIEERRSREARDEDEFFAAGKASEDEVIEAEAARSVPPPLVATRVARRAALGGAVVVAAIALWAGARSIRSKSVGAPAASVPLLAISAEKVPAAPAASAAETDPDVDDDLEALPFDEAKGLLLRKEARAMLEAGRIDEGVATARRAIEANPNDSENYILLAAGLQDQGRWEEARQIFGKCVRQSTRAERSECVYFATRGR
jgi:tetratricopeptide (TPR) repeat protein